MTIDTFTKLLVIRIVASKICGLESIFPIRSRKFSSSTLSTSLSVNEKYAVSEPETKADTPKAIKAITIATIPPIDGAYTVIKSDAAGTAIRIWLKT